MRWPDARYSAVEVRPLMTRVGRGDVRTADRHEDLLRALAPQVLGALVRRYGRFDACEDAVQEALLAAATQWPARGRARQPAGLAHHRRARAGSPTSCAASRRAARREDAASVRPTSRAPAPGAEPPSTTTR